MNYTIFISSADSYSDLWPIFFDLFKMHWPDFKRNIYLNTEVKDFYHEGLNITCTKVGKLGSFGKTFRAGLKKVPMEDVMLIMIDYLFMGPVNILKLTEYFKFFKKENLDTLCLVHQNYREIGNTINADLERVIPPSKDMFSFQIAFWNKSTLYEMTLPHENPWASEWFGTRRANKMKIKLACLSRNAQRPILYDLAGCLHKGKWLQSAIDYLNIRGYNNIEFEKRGLYEEVPNSLKDRIKVKWMLIKCGLMGSYWDLLLR